MTDGIIDAHNGIFFRVEAVPKGALFVGHFVILNATVEAGSTRTTDSFQSVTGAWATAEEALTYATEAAHHAIEQIALFTEN